MVETGELRPRNTETVKRLLGTELKDNLDAIRQLGAQLTEDSEGYRQERQELSFEQRPKQMEDMKDYIQGQLSNLAYYITEATQKIEEGLRLTGEDCAALGRQLRETELQAEMKVELKNRLGLAELTRPRLPPQQSSIKIVDDPTSRWKTPPAKYRRQELDLTVLDHLGLTGLSAGREVGEGGRRLSRSYSIDSTYSGLARQMSVQSGTMAAGSTASYTGTMKGPKNIKRKKLSAPIKEEPPAAEDKEGAPEDKESMPEDKESKPEPPAAPGALAPPPPPNPFGTPSVSPVPTRRTQDKSNTTVRMSLLPSFESGMNFPIDGELDGEIIAFLKQSESIVEEEPENSTDVPVEEELPPNPFLDEHSDDDEIDLSDLPAPPRFSMT